MTVTTVWRERLRTSSWLATGTLLLVALIWFLLRTPEATPRMAEKLTTIALLSPPSSPSRKASPQRPINAPQSALVPKPTAPVNTPKPAAPATDKTDGTAKPLVENAHADANPYQFAQSNAEGASASSGNGFTIGGGGKSCGNIITRPYLDLINAQVMHTFRDRVKTNNRDFQVQVHIWFDAVGGVQKTELADSTGDADLDRAITHQLNQIALGQSIPSCMQPIRLRVSEPWTGSFARHQPTTQSVQATQ